MKIVRKHLVGLPLLSTLILGGCATSNLGTIAWGTVGGAALGAVVGRVAGPAARVVRPGVVEDEALIAAAAEAHDSSARGVKDHLTQQGNR